MAEFLPLSDLADGSPTGPNLEMDPIFGEMERAAQGKPETQYGSKIEPAVPPDWKETARLAEDLLLRTRDLRVMVLYALARLHLTGLPGYALAVSAIRRTLETSWESVHPVLDPEDDNDPLQRANALLLLKDPARVLRPLRDMPLASTPRTGPVSWRDIAVMNGVFEPEPGREKPSESLIRGAFAGTDAAALERLKTAVEGLLGDLVAIPKVFDTYATFGSGPDFDDLIKLIRDIQKELTRFAMAPAASEEEADEPPSATAPGEPAEIMTAAAPRAARGVVSIQSITAIGNREDALRALELASGYFRRSEPSSPLPLLIDRALLLAPMPFLDILRNLAPDGLMQAQIVVGSGDQ
jgi:type VI secretion system protein ImpA